MREVGLGLAPLAEPEFDLGALHGEPTGGPGPGREALLGTDRRLQALAAAAGAVQRVGEVGRHEGLVDRLAGGACAGDRLVEGRLAGLLLAEREERHAEAVEHRRDHVVGADRLRGLQRVGRRLPDLAVAALQHQQ